MSKQKALHDYDEPRGPVLSARFVVALLLVVVGIAWIAYYYVAVRVDPNAIVALGSPAPKAGNPKFLADLEMWNYLIGFGAILVGLIIAADPSTPMGRGRGVVISMLGCFLVGLLWICTFYVISNNSSGVPVFNDLGQYNLMLGIGLMAVGFTYATRWE